MSFIKTWELTKKYYTDSGWKKKMAVLAVDNISFSIDKDQTIGIVGESGCGKSTLLRLLLRLEPPTAGKIFHDEKDITVLKDKELKFYRRKVQAVFQDPASSLNQRFTVRKIILEPLNSFHPEIPEKEKELTAAGILEQVGLQKADMNRYPHELSGGQQRRVAIARALSIKPQLIICDEATSGLDVSVQAQILNLLGDLRDTLKINYLFVSHDLAAVRYLCPKVAVMYAGKIVEILSAPTKDSAFHPYTKALMAGEPDFQGDKKLTILPGEPPDASRYPSGCRFHPRCPEVTNICKEVNPELTEISQGHKAACHKINNQ